MINLPIIPNMQCDVGCEECCHVVGCNKKEYEDVIRFAELRNIKPVKQGLKCPWFQNGGCSVYDERPTVCRLYGHVDSPQMRCPRGYNVNMPLEDVKRFDSLIYLKREDVKFLHEIIPEYTFDTVLQMLTDYANE